MATARRLTRAECPVSTYPPISVTRASARTVCRYVTLIPAYLRSATCVTSSGAANTATAASPMTSAANAMSRADAPVAAAIANLMRSSSPSATPNLVRSASVRMSAVTTDSRHHATMISPSMTGSCDHHRPPISPALASGRNAAATHATASSRADIAVSLAGRPTARCGSAPTIMASAVTAMTWAAPSLAGSLPIRSTSA